ncbi:MAG: enoyl-CoA hydratase/isomerase family protein [Tenacibaculum sp.]
MSTTQADWKLTTVIEGKIAWLEFYHRAGNSLPSKLLKSLAYEFNSLSNNNKVALIVLSSKGEKAFCAGASFLELASIDNFNDAKEFFLGFANIINAMRKCLKPIIGRVQGKAVGGGLGIIASCDYILSVEQASIKLSELSLGIGPFVIAPAVRRKIGTSALAELSLDASNWKNALWAKQKGLYTQVFKTIEELDKELRIFTEKLALYSPIALSKIKQMLWANTEDWDFLLEKRAEISGRLVLSELTQKAIAKFKK